MDPKVLTDYCLSKKGAVEDFPFGPDVLTVKVSSKVFALISEHGKQIHISLKCDPFLAQSLREQYTAVTPGYHLNKKHWNTVVADDSVPVQELFWMVDDSYDLVLKGLTKAEREDISEAT